MRSSLNFVIFCIAILLINACCDCNIPDVYYPGVVKIKANTDFPNGMIIALDAFYDDDELESLSRAIIYKHEVDKVFDLGDTVLYKINAGWSKNDVLLATDVQRNDYYIGELELRGNNDFVQVKKIYGRGGPEKVRILDMTKTPKVGEYRFNLNENGEAVNIVPFDPTMYASKKLLYNMKTKYRINLHQSDPHREGPFHVKRHIRPPKLILQIANMEQGEVLKAVVMEDESGVQSKYIINDPLDLPYNLPNQYYLYYKRSIPTSSLSSDIRSFLNLDLSVNSTSVYDISRSHDHTF